MPSEFAAAPATIHLKQSQAHLVQPGVLSGHRDGEGIEIARGDLRARDPDRGDPQDPGAAAEVERARLVAQRRPQRAEGLQAQAG